MNLHDALGDIRSKYSSGYIFTIEDNDYSTLEWSDDNDIPKPTEEELNEELARIEALEDYQKPRQMAYPSIQDQMDMQYHDAVDGTTTWQETIKAVKDAHPKP